MMPSLRRDYNMAVNDAIRRTHTVVLARLAPGLLGLCSRLALGEEGGLALAGAGRRVELAAEALVLGLQVTEASLKGLAAGTQDGLHTCIIREAGPQLRRPRPQDRDQRELHPLNKYVRRSIASCQLGAGMAPWRFLVERCLCEASQRAYDTTIHEHGRRG